MPRIRIRPKARRDLVLIWRDIGAVNPTAADRLLDRIAGKLEGIAANPLLGQARPDLGAEIRHAVIRPYLILYRPIAAGIEVQRILHGARDLQRFIHDKGQSD